MDSIVIHADKNMRAKTQKVLPENTVKESSENTVKKSSGNAEKTAAKRKGKIKRRRSFIRRAAKWTLAACLFGAFAAVMAAAAVDYTLRHPAAQKRIIEFAEEQLSKYFLGDVTIERFESNIVSFINLYGVKAVGKSEFRDSIYVGSVRINYWAGALARRRFHVTSAQINDVRGHVVMEEGNKIMVPLLPMRLLDSNYNLLSKFEVPEFPYQALRGSMDLYREIPRHLRQTLSHDMPDPKSWPVQVSAGRVRVDGINAVYRDLANDMVGEIRGGSATAQFYAIDSFHVRLHVPDAEYRSPWWSGTLDTIAAEGVVTWTHLEIAESLVSGSGTRVLGRGRLSYFPDGPWDLRGDFRTSIRPLPILYEHAPLLGRDGIFEGTATYRGKLYDPIWQARARGTNITYNGVNIFSMDVDANYDGSAGGDETGRARIRGNSDIGQFDANAAAVMNDLIFGPDEFGDYSANVNLTGLDAGVILRHFNIRQPFPITGGSVRVNTSGTNFQFPHEVRVVAAADMGAAYQSRADVSASLRGGAFSADGRWGINSVTARGSVNFETMRARGSAEADMPDPAEVAMAVFGETVSGSVAVAATFDAPLDNIMRTRADVNLTGEEIRWRGLVADSLEAELKTEGGRARLLGASGFVFGDLESAAEYFNVDGLGGWVAADFTMRGDLGKLDSLSLNVYLRGRGVAYRGYALDTLVGFAALREGTVRWNNLHMRGMGLSLDGNGHLQLVPHIDLAARNQIFNMQNGARVAAGRVEITGKIVDKSVDGRYNFESIPLRALDPFIPAPHHVRGVATAGGTVTGTTSNLALETVFRIVDPAYGKYGASLIVGEGRLADSVVTASAAVFAQDGSRPVELTALLPFVPSSNWAIDESGGRPARLTTSASGLDAAHITPLFEELSDMEIDGRVTFDVVIENNVVIVNDNNAAVVNDDVVNNDNAVSTNNNNVIIANNDNPVITNDNAVIVNNNTIITNDNTVITANNAAPINNWTTRGTVAVADGSFYHPEHNVTINNISFGANIFGTLADPGATFTLATNRVRTAELRIGRTEFVGRTTKDTLTLDRGNIHFRDGGRVGLSGTLVYGSVDSLLHAGRINARYNIDSLPVSAFSRFMQEIELHDGVISGGGRVGGGGGRPLVDGTLRMRGLNLMIGDIEPVVGPVEASIEFADSTIRIAWVSGRWGRGFMSAQGHTFWNFNGLHGTDIRGRVTNLTFELPEVINVGVESADLQMVNLGSGFLLRGRARLGQTTYERDLNFIELINQAQIGGAVRRAPHPFLETVRLHVDVDLANTMGIDMNLGTLTMDGRLAVVGTLAEPRIAGRINITDGFVRYIDRQFQIVEGTLFNQDAAAFNPNLRVVARTDVVTFSQTSRVENFTITLSMTGTLEEPVIRFTSEPPLSELDILSILTFGERLGGMGSDMNNRLANIAAQQVVGLGTRRLERLLDIDRISVSGNLLGSPAGVETGDGVTIGATKRFTDRLSVIYEVNTGRQINQRATAQYRLLRNVYLEGETTNTGENAVNITIRHSQ